MMISSWVWRSAAGVAAYTFLTFAWFAGRKWEKGQFARAASSTRIDLTIYAGKLVGRCFYLVAAVYIYVAPSVYLAVVYPALFGDNLQHGGPGAIANLLLTLFALGNLFFNYVMVQTVETAAPYHSDSENAGGDQIQHVCSKCNMVGICRLATVVSMIPLEKFSKNRTVGFHRYFWLFLFYLWSFHFVLLVSLQRTYFLMQSAVSADSAILCAPILQGLQTSSNRSLSIDPETCDILQLTQLEQFCVDSLFTTGVAVSVPVFMLWAIHCYLSATNQTTVETVTNFATRKSTLSFLKGEHTHSRGSWNENARDMLRMDSSESFWSLFLPKLPDS